MLYTNRANARLKLQHYEAVIPDCQASLNLLESNMKAYYFMSQAELELGRKVAALASAEMAYDLCSGFKVGGRKGTEKIAGYDPKWASSLTSVTALILRCKKEAWELRERSRLREAYPLLEELIQHLETIKSEDLELLEQQGLGDIERKDLVKETEEACAAKIDLLQSNWLKALGPEAQKREVPDWAIDDITFAIMHDPVMVCTSSQLVYVLLLIYHRQRQVTHMSVRRSRSIFDDLQQTP